MVDAGVRAPRAGRRIVLNLPEARRGERLDQALAGLLPDQSRAALQRLMHEGRVSLQEGPARPSYRVRGGERIVLEIPPPAPARPVPEFLPLDILHEDADLVVLNKPAGLTVHPGAGSRGGTLVNALLHHCRDLSGIGGAERPGIVHRLDRDTTGVLVIAKNDMTHRSLAGQFKERTVKKVYEALVWGRPRNREGTIDAPIARHPTARLKMAIRSGGRESRTRYRLLESLGAVSLVELCPETGRTHQLRVHLKSIGHPIVGDRHYGGLRAGAVRVPSVRWEIEVYKGLALHARSLA
ncbi:MAG TPA: RluA family pseudouridine synthase, partial [Candidatus Polarisedimenticolia bacterium]|nr:RluA family pseudouridine synthase [Candidatus Polarisedimenticolia bacterium]